MRFRATLELHGKTATGFVVPDAVVTALGPSKRPPVRVTINGHTYRTSIASMGGRFLLGVSAEQRANTGIAAGDAVDVEVEADDEVREVTVPDDFAAALATSPAAKRAFEAMAYSHKQRWVLSIDGAKTAETRQRRIAKAVEDIAAAASATTSKSTARKK